MDQQSSTNLPSATPKSKTPLILGIVGGLAAIGIIGGIAAEKAKQQSSDMSKTTNPSDQTANTNIQPSTQITPPSSSDTQVNEVTRITDATQPPTETTPKPAPAPSTNSSGYKDGTYAADATYNSPAGEEQVHVSVTMKNGVITESQFQGTPRSPRSQMMMDAFSQNYKPLVVGKSINDIQLSVVSGSSLTPIGFNNALAKIKAEARM